MARFDRAIPPGGSGKIVLSLNSKKVHGAFTKTASVQSNDSAHPRLRLTIKGLLRHYVEIEPQRLFLRGFREDRPRARVKIISNLKAPLLIKGIISPELAKKVAWELNTVQGGKQYQLEVANQAGVGRYNGKILLLTNSPQKPRIEIPVYADITGDIGYYPPRLELGRLKAGSKGQVGQVITIWKNRGKDKDLKIGEVTYDEERFEVEVRQQGPRYMVYVRPRMENLKLGEFTGEVKIKTTSADLPELAVPVHGWVQ